ncbi:CDP-glycerol:glycerophosphate glycerophosphotransferase [Campylobacter molothri]|uniref:CDP-glycerol:glycerophosphate glycerophosphotransferase n=1 Tax=Campylobacter molothri TaxID=1032242 RepID=UPI003DA0797E
MKKYKGYSKYVVISAVYNVEKYLDDYFKSIIKQRLDFKKNIFLILVDDGSTDSSAKIIKNYQKKYPKNVIYLYKKNGGQASARNFGLQYLKENNYQIPWIAFTDPDDFLDLNYFYEIDKYIKKHKECKISMLGTHPINYHGKDIYKEHILYKFKWLKTSIVSNYKLVHELPSGATSIFLYDIIDKHNLRFDENIEARANFEDVSFAYKFLLFSQNFFSLYLKESIYYIRKRTDSTTATALQKKEYYLGMPKQLIDLCRLSLKYKGKVTIFEQNICLYHIFWTIHKIFDDEYSLDLILNEAEKDDLVSLIKKLFSFIDKEAIYSFRLIPNFSWFYKISFITMFKDDPIDMQNIYVEYYKNGYLRINYYTNDLACNEEILLDGIKSPFQYKKILQHNFLNRLFIYEKILFVKYAKNSLNLSIRINNIHTLINYSHQLQSILLLKDCFNNNKDEIWLLIDRTMAAGDNAEYFYDYLANNLSKKNIFFGLNRSSPDWKRLEAKNYNLVDTSSVYFSKFIKKVTHYVCSDLENNILSKISFYETKIIFLQHGVIKDDLSRWLNTKKLDLFITSTKQEYDSIASDFNKYKFSKKEVVLTGLPRFDYLQSNANDKPTNNILVFPTWRNYLISNIDQNGIRKKNNTFTESIFFQKWYSFLYSDELKKICNSLNYKIMFVLHPNFLCYSNLFERKSFDHIEVIKENVNYLNLFNISSLMITDYSSSAFDMAFLRKPVIYYQFDRDDFFKNHTYSKGYFDYLKDGFGPVVADDKELFLRLGDILNNKCIPDDLYYSNIEKAFACRDKKCCQRIYDAIQSI